MTLTGRSGAVVLVAVLAAALGCGGDVFSCAMTVTAGGMGGARASGRYDVQVLANGCFVAERRTRTPPLGQAVYGCGVTRRAGG
jgi:hypothetical protein